MKRLLVVVVALVVVSCGNSNPGDTLPSPFIYRDSETGCEYLSAGGRGITPRMGRDGRQICR